MIGVIDYDEVDESNLQRQVIHTEETVGMNKALSAKKRIEKLNSSCKCFPFKEVLNKDNAAKIVELFDVVIDASDNVKKKIFLFYLFFILFLYFIIFIFFILIFIIFLLIFYLFIFVFFILFFYFIYIYIFYFVIFILFLFIFFILLYFILFYFYFYFLL